MAAYVLRLRLALLFGALRGHAGHVVRVVSGLVILAAATAAACWALLTMRDAAPDAAHVMRYARWRERFNSRDDGHAAERVVSRILDQGFVDAG